MLLKKQAAADCRKTPLGVLLREGGRKSSGQGFCGSGSYPPVEVTTTSCPKFSNAQVPAQFWSVTPDPPLTPITTCVTIKGWTTCVSLVPGISQFLQTLPFWRKSNLCFLECGMRMEASAWELCLLDQTVYLGTPLEGILGCVPSRFWTSTSDDFISVQRRWAATLF